MYTVHTRALNKPNEEFFQFRYLMYLLQLDSALVEIIEYNEQELWYQSLVESGMDCQKLGKNINCHPSVKAASNFIGSLSHLITVGRFSQFFSNSYVYFASFVSNRIIKLSRIFKFLFKSKQPPFPPSPLSTSRGRPHLTPACAPLVAKGASYFSFHQLSSLQCWYLPAWMSI